MAYTKHDNRSRYLLPNRKRSGLASRVRLIKTLTDSPLRALLFTQPRCCLCFTINNIRSDNKGLLFQRTLCFFEERLRADYGDPQANCTPENLAT